MDFSVQNAMNRAAGQSFEDIISDSLTYYFEKGYASIEKTPELFIRKKRSLITKEFCLEDKRSFSRQNILQVIGFGKTQ